MSHLLFSLLVSLLMTLVAISPAQAADGDLDPSFGDAGKVIRLLSGASHQDVVLQPDGKIVSVGTAYGAWDVIVMRHLADGSPDPSFGTDGIVTVGSHEISYSAAAVALAPTGEIVVAGYTSPDQAYETHDLLLIRLKASGALDPAFGADGVVVSDIGSGEVASDVAIQPGGRIIVAGETSDTLAQDTTLAGYTPEGTLDTTFAEDGVLSSALGGSDMANAMDLHNDGRIVIGGYFQGNFLVGRATADGRWDTSFGTHGGFAWTRIGTGFDEAFGVAVQPDGKVVVVGRDDQPRAGDSGDTALVRFNPTGHLDGSFSEDGVASLNLGSDYDAAMGAVIADDGSIFTAGLAGFPYDIAVAHFTSDGTPDAAFGIGGAVLTDLGYDDNATDLAIQPDGKVVVAGSYGGNNPALLRYLTALGVVDDRDGDGVADPRDNCIDAANPGQEDADGDGTGDVCDVDLDGDGIINSSDNCPGVTNAGQVDSDRDGVGDACEINLAGRMSGGGTLGSSPRVAYSFELDCDAARSPAELEVAWEGRRFELTTPTQTLCGDNPALSPGSPTAGALDTLAGSGIGTLEGSPGASISFLLTDAGEPGSSDLAGFTIRDAAGAVVLHVSGSPKRGNHQALDEPM